MPVVTRAASLRLQGLAQEQRPPVGHPAPRRPDMAAESPTDGDIAGSGPVSAMDSMNMDNSDSEELSPVRPARAAFTPDPETASKQSKTAVDLRDD